MVCFGSWFCDSFPTPFIFFFLFLERKLFLRCSLSLSVTHFALSACVPLFHAHSVFLFSLVLAACVTALPQAQSCVRGDYGHRANGGAARWGSESQSLGMFSCLESQVCNAGVLAVAFGSRHRCRRRRCRVCERGDWKSEGRGREHQVRSVSSQVRVQMGVGVGNPVQLELGLDLENRTQSESTRTFRKSVGVCGCVPVHSITNICNLIP